MNQALISHSGTVTQIHDQTIFVKITSQSACADCHAKGACTGFDSQDKIIEINSTKSDTYKVGQAVTVSITQKLGFVALFWGYLLPFLLVMATLITTTIVTGKQEIAGLASLAILGPYYLVLYQLRSKLKKVFQFEIK